MRVLPNATASSFISARLCPADMPRSEHFAATLFQYLKDVNRIPRGQCLMVDGHFLVGSNWEDEALKRVSVKGTQGQLDHKHGSEDQVKPEPEPEPETKDKQRKTQDSYIEESHRHEEDITKTDKDNKITDNIGGNDNKHEGIVHQHSLQKVPVYDKKGTMEEYGRQNEEQRNKSKPNIKKDKGHTMGIINITIHGTSMETYEGQRSHGRNGQESYMMTTKTWKQDPDDETGRYGNQDTRERGYMTQEQIREMEYISQHNEDGWGTDNYGHFGEIGRPDANDWAQSLSMDQIVNMNQNGKIKIYDATSGGGLGAIAAIIQGGKIIGYSETDATMGKMMNEITGKSSLGDAFKGSKPYDVDIYLSGFPCHGYSVMNRAIPITKSSNWKYTKQAEIIIQMNPKTIVMEQVYSLESVRATEVLKGRLGQAYETYSRVLTASEYGDGTKRMRIWTVGFRRDLKQSSFVWPEGIYKETPIDTSHMLEEAWSKLEHNKAERVIIETHPLGRYSEGKVSKIGRMTDEGANEFGRVYGETIPKSLGGRYVYTTDGPLWTVRQDGRGGTIQVGKPRRNGKIEVRPISSIEATLVQSLPHDYYRFMEDAGIKAQEIMKAAVLGWPIKTAGAVISSVISTLRKCKEVPCNVKDEWVELMGPGDSERYG